MRKSIALFALILISYIANGQILKPATWSAGTSVEESKIGDEIDLVFKVAIDPDWYLYSSDFSCEVGPIVTTFTFQPSDSYELVGEIRPIGAKKKYDEIFECEYTYFRGHAEFRQAIKVLQKGLKVSGEYEYQVCTDVDGKCIPFQDDFELTIAVLANETTPSNEDKFIREPAKSANNDLRENNTSTTSSSDKNVEPIKEDNEKPSNDAKTAEEKKESIASENASITQEVVEQGGIRQVKMEPFFGDNYEKPTESYGWFMLAAFLAGLAALLTPCVFPMIPMTVSFFTGGGNSKAGGKFKALFYGISIVGIYTLIGSLIAPLMGPETANDLATEWLPNLIFFAVFIFFALSFFGMYEIVLPSSMINNMDRQADKGGLVGVFFMAFTLVLVSFSCTGPIVGTILVESAGGQFLKPILGMFAFSMAFAIPFTLFAIFPGWLNTLPKSGGWLNAVKVILGFVELALAFKFLSIADQAFHWGVLDREVNIAIWVVIFTLMGLYLLGKIKLPHDSDLPHTSVPRLILAIATFSFVVYLIPGMFGAPLKALAGYLPPMYTHDFNVAGLIRETQDEGNDAYYENCDEPKYADFLHLPHGIKGYFDYAQALACAKAQDKPIFIDFTGHGCTNCREMEAVVWSDPKVLKKLKEEFVVVALYVDDKTELPEEKWYISSYDNKVKKTIGKQNADMQIQRANNNAQPNYFLIGQDQKALTEPVAYTSVTNFVDFLDTGLANYKASKQLANQ